MVIPRGKGKWDIERDCQTCFFARHQKTLNGGDLKKMKIKDLPKEKPRVELGDLPQTNILIAVREEMQEETVTDGQKKVGGLVIWFAQKDKKEFPQKYSKISGQKLAAAMLRLGLEDTKDLQKEYMTYKLEPMRVGYPRYIPVAPTK